VRSSFLDDPLQEVLKTFQMESCNVAKTTVVGNLKFAKGEEKTIDATLFKQVVGSLRYI